METASACQPTPVVEGGWSVGAKYFSALVEVYVLIQHLNNKPRIPHFSVLSCTELMHNHNQLQTILKSGEWENQEGRGSTRHRVSQFRQLHLYQVTIFIVHCRYCQYLSLAAVHFNYITFQTKTFVGWGQPRNPLFFLPWHSQIFSKRRIKNCNNTTFNQQWTCSTQ